jgi:hypothetical protein
MKIALALILVVAVAGVGAWLLNRRSRAKSSEIAPAHVLQDEHGLYAENRPLIKLDPAKVPEGLRHLIPLAEKWGIGDDIIRNDLIDQATDAEKQELHDALYEPYERITAWLDSFSGDAMSDEAATFMYMQGTLDEMGIFILEEKRSRDIP